MAFLPNVKAYDFTQKQQRWKMSLGNNVKHYCHLKIFCHKCLSQLQVFHIILMLVTSPKLVGGTCQCHSNDQWQVASRTALSHAWISKINVTQTNMFSEPAVTDEAQGRTSVTRVENTLTLQNKDCMDACVFLFFFKKYDIMVKPR